MKRLALIGAVAVAFLASGASAVDSFAVHLVSQTSSTLTLGWSPQPGYGYLFSADGVLRSRTNDPNTSQVKFSKQYSSFDIDVITKGANGHYPTVAQPPVASIRQTIQNGTTIPNITGWRAVYDANGDGVEDDPGSVQFLVDGTLILTENDVPFGDDLADGSPLVANGQHTFDVRAIGSGGAVLATNSVTATVGSAPPPPAACADGIDNDGDGKIDYPADPGCLSAADSEETDSSSPPPTTITSAQLEQRSSVSGTNVSNVTVNGGNDIAVTGSNVTWDNVKVTGFVVNIVQPSVGFRMVNSSIVNGRFNIFGADSVTLDGNVFDGAGLESSNQIWDSTSRHVPNGITIRNNVIKNFHGPDCNTHGEGIYLGTSINVLIENNSFDVNGCTSHIFFTWFGNTADPNSSWPRNVCVKRNTFGPRFLNTYYDLNFRSEIGTGANIKVNQPGAATTAPQFNAVC